jgi:hypothetical protein
MLSRTLGIGLSSAQENEWSGLSGEPLFPPGEYPKAQEEKMAQEHKTNRLIIS